MPRVGRLRAARSLPPGGPEKAGPAAIAASPAENRLHLGNMLSAALP
jgi:hypothetical protein